MTRAERLAEILSDLIEVSPEVEAAAVVSTDGLPMASVLPSHVEEDRLAAMSAALLTLGEKAATGLGKGTLEQVFVEADEGYVVLMAAGEEAVLVTIAAVDAKAGLILFEMREAARRIVEATQGDETESADHDTGDDYEDLSEFDAFPGMDDGDEDEPIVDPFATPTDPFATPPPPPPVDEGDDEPVSSWN